MIVDVAALYAPAFEAVLGRVLPAGLGRQEHPLRPPAIDTAVSASAEGGPTKETPADDRLACRMGAGSVALAAF